jgi:RNA polymerase sigma-70 factor (ECF subfamily)
MGDQPQREGRMSKARHGLHVAAPALPRAAGAHAHGLYGTIAPHMGHVRRFLRKRLREAADDLEQQVVLAVIEDPSRLTAAANLEAFLLGIAKNQLRLHLRRRERSARRDAAASAFLRELSNHDPDGVDPAQPDLSKLPEAMRVVIRMTYWEGMTQPEIARVLGVPVGTVATRLRLAKTKLRAELFERQSSASS